MKDERISPRTFYMCKGTEGSSGTAARLLHIIALGGFVDLRMGKKKQQKNPDMNRKKQWPAAQVQKYCEETWQQDGNTDKRHKGQQRSRWPFQCFASKKGKPTIVTKTPKYAIPAKLTQRSTITSAHPKVTTCHKVPQSHWELHGYYKW